MIPCTNPNTELDVVTLDHARTHRDAQRARDARAATVTEQPGRRTGLRPLVGALLTVTVLTMAPPVFTGSADEIPPSGCNRADGGYDFGCRVATGRPDGWFDSTAEDSPGARSVPGNIR